MGGGGACAALIGIKLRTRRAYELSYRAWRRPSPCPPASAAPDRAAAGWADADGDRRAPARPPVAAPYWDTAGAARADSLSPDTAGSPAECAPGCPPTARPSRDWLRAAPPGRL